MLKTDFIVVEGWGRRIAVAQCSSMLEAKVGQTIVFVPGNEEAKRELDAGRVWIYTDAWNGPPLSICMANRLWKPYYTFDKPGTVSFLLDLGDTGPGVDAYTGGLQEPQPTFTVVVKP